ncbi:MAG: redoxin domain-containing protein [gamma proteobacterium symbiont of Taylorina sp.]|nr:redoxin domain-containing protein [gamma proteobacterium symbiont of Taylorina sp.]
MRLKSNELAPTFSATSLNGKDFNLSKPRNKLLLLAFFRYASCPLCNLRIHELIENYHAVKDNLDIIAVFQSPAEKINQYVGKQSISFYVLPDPDKKLYCLYGVESSWFGFAKAWTIKISQVFDAVLKHRYLPGSVEGELNRIPADFIIGIDNKIIRAYYGNDIGDHLPLAEIHQLVKSYEARQ